MAISGKPNRDKGQPASEAQLLAFVEKGGSVAQTSAAPAAKGKGAQHPLKFPDIELFERLEHARAAGAVETAPQYLDFASDSRKTRAGNPIDMHRMCTRHLIRI